MKEQIPIGMNRTGVHMSPFATKDMQIVPTEVGALITSGDESSIAEIRRAYIEEAEPLGSVPLPLTLKGAVTTGMSMIAGNQPQIFIDKLGERLAFERTGTRLYDALMAKFEGSEDQKLSMTVDELQKIRDEEGRHFMIVADAIESIGGDPTVQTPCADLVGVESIGLLQVVSDPRTTLAQSLHAMLVAEMTDQAGWELLIALADEQGHASIVSDFNQALAEERRHVAQVRAWFEEATLGKRILADQAGAADTASLPLH